VAAPQQSAVRAASEWRQRLGDDDRLWTDREEPLHAVAAFLQTETARCRTTAVGQILAKRTGLDLQREMRFIGPGAARKTLKKAVRRERTAIKMRDSGGGTTGEQRKTPK